jgi:hypothetical protein
MLSIIDSDGCQGKDPQLLAEQIPMQGKNHPTSVSVQVSSGTGRHCSKNCQTCNQIPKTPREAMDRGRENSIARRGL